MIPVEAEDIPLVKQIAQVPRRVLHRTEWHADQRVAARVAARGAGQVGRDAGQAGPRDPRHVRAMSADLEKAQAEGWLAVVAPVLSVHAPALRRSEQEARPLVHGLGKLRSLASGTVLGAPSLSSHRPVVVPRNRRALSINSRRGVYSPPDDNRGGRSRVSRASTRSPTSTMGVMRLQPPRTTADRNTRSGTTTSRRTLTAN